MKLQPISEVHKSRGSAMILVVVVTVLLSIVGVMFLMISRVGEMETAAVADNRDLDAAVDTVVNRIHDVLIEDLFGQDVFIVNAQDSPTVTNPDADESYDFPSHSPVTAGLDGKYWSGDEEPVPGHLDDYWLASLEPVWFDTGPDGLTGTLATIQDDTYAWPHITDLWGSLQVYSDSIFNQIYDSPPVYWIDPDNDQDSTQWATGMWNTFQVGTKNVRAKIIKPKDRMKVILQGASGTTAIPDPWEDETKTCLFGARADADGDGVADSRWVQVPNLTTNRGKPVYTAVRIIDNCAMLNLNGAFCFYPGDYGNVSLFSKQWYERKQLHPVFAPVPEAYHDNQGTGSGRYLTEINYLPFLRGHDLSGHFFEGAEGDDWYNLLIARNLMKDQLNDIPLSPRQCQAALMNIEKAGPKYYYFDIADELELRNRYLLTGNAEAVFEQEGVAHFSLDADAAAYAPLKIPRDTTNFNVWKYRIDPRQFEKWDMSGNLRTIADPLSPYFFRYDRRHVCTAYSYDRTLTNGTYPLMEADFAASGFPESARQVFWPKHPYSPATTDIASPMYNTATDRWEYNTNNIETRRRILHLLVALREFYLPANYSTLTLAQQTTEKDKAALKAAQTVANIIDYSDDSAAEGPFYNAAYGSQVNADCTFITQSIINQMITEVSTALGVPLVYNFGLNATDIVFGYEKQPFISEIFAAWNTGAGVDAALQDFGIELINPYPQMIDIRNWRIKIGNTLVPALSTFNQKYTDDQWHVPGSSGTGALGYAVFHGTGSGYVNFAPGGVSFTDPITDFDSIDTTFGTAGTSLEIQLLRPAPAWVQANFPDPVNTGVNIQYILVDRISDTDVRSVLGVHGQYNLERDDNDWKFIYGRYAPVKSISTDPTNSYTLVTDNTANISAITNLFQIGVADDGLSLARRHDLEVLGLYGNEYENSANPDAALTARLANMNQAIDTFYFNLSAGSSDLLDYVCTISRPDYGSLPGRININTAPVHVIAAAIPPSLADPSAASGTAVFSALQLARAIVEHRRLNGPYQTISDLMNVQADSDGNGILDTFIFKRYTTGGLSATNNVGMQSIQDDIEEDHWVLSNLANKFTVRSDTFTAYILVRLGEDGPQRRMIGIFDRSQVWDKNDRPKLVALHPVPDPR